MTSKKKPATKATKVQLKDLKPKRNPKGGKDVLSISPTNTCSTTPTCRT